MASEGASSQPVLRVAGTVELGGLTAPPNPSRSSLLERSAAAYLPALAPESGWKRDPSGDWLGFRPTTPDALPFIGSSLVEPRVLYATGHQHVGYTLGGITGQLVAELIDGEVPAVDLGPFRPDRFPG